MIVLLLALGNAFAGLVVVAAWLIYRHLNKR
jgi:hypothetical protein